jgi:hypothetical protein
LIYFGVTGSATGSSGFELGLCIEGEVDSRTIFQAEEVSVVGFADLDDDDRREVILETVEEARQLVQPQPSRCVVSPPPLWEAERWIYTGDAPPSSPPWVRPIGEMPRCGAKPVTAQTCWP